MDRLKQLRAGAESSRDATLDSSSPPSEAYMSANDSSKYFSLSDSTFDITPIKDVSLASAASAAEPDHTMADPDELLSNLSPITKKDVMLDSFKIGKQIEAANILSGGVDIFEDNENSFDGDELVIDDNVDMDDKSNLDDKSPLEEAVAERTLETHVDVGSKDTEVLLQIDGKHVDAIDIGNGLYLYRKAGQEELAAVQIITEDNQQSPSFKFLKVRENVEGNLEVYEEFEIEVSKDAPVNAAKPAKKAPHVPIKDIKKVISESSSNRVVEKKDKTPPKVAITVEQESESDSKSELNLNGKMMKFNESRKSPVIGSFTPMTYHSTPNKEGKPLTKTMVDQQLHPSRHSDNVKKTIEVHTDNQTKKFADESNKQKSDNLMKAGNENIVAKEQAANEVKEGVTDSLDKKDLSKIKEDVAISPATVKDLNVAKTLSEDESKIKVDNINTVDSVNTVDPTLCDSKIKETISEDLVTKSIQNIASKNTVFASLIGRTTNTEISKPNEDKAVEIRDSLDKTGNASTKDDNNKLNKETNVVESSKPKINEEDKVEIPKEIEKEEIESSDKGQESIISTNSLLTTDKEETKQDLTTDKEETRQETKQDLTVLQKETTKPTDISSSDAQPKPGDVERDFQADKDLKEMKTSEVTSTSITKNLETSKEKEKEVNITEVSQKIEQKTVSESQTSCQDALKDESNKVTSEKFIAVQSNESDPSKLPAVEEIVSNELSQIKKSNPFDTNVAHKAVGDLEKLKSISKETDPKPVSNISKSQIIPVAIVSETDSKIDKINLEAKPMEEQTISEKQKPMAIPKLKTVPATKTNVLEKKLDPKMDPQTEELIPLAKAVEVKSLPKPIILNRIEKKIEPVAIAQTSKITPILKANEPKSNLRKETSTYPIVTKVTASNQPGKAFELKTIPKTVLLNPVPKGIIPKPSKVERVDTGVANKSGTVVITSNKVIAPSRDANIKSSEPSNSDPKPINNNHTAVPFGKWTDANRQQFLNQFKEIKAPATSNTKQIKNSNDLNRIDVLKKIDSQRFNNTCKAQDKSNMKNTVFSTKIAPPKVETKIPVKNEGLKVRAKPVDTKVTLKPESTAETVTSSVNVASEVVAPTQEETREVNFSDLIGRAIVDMLNRPVPMPMTRSPLDEPSHVENKDAHVTQAEKNAEQLNIDQQKLKNDQQKLNVDVDQQKLNIDNQKIKSDQQKLPIDQRKLNVDNQKIKSDQQKLNVDQRKLNIDNQKIKSDQQKLNVDQRKLNIDNQKITSDKQKLNVDHQKLNVDNQNIKSNQQKLNTDQQNLKTDHRTLNTDQQKLKNDQKLTIEQKIDEDSSGSLDDIEMKMNELHGIPFVERPPHELPRVHKTYSKSSRDDKKKSAMKLLPVTSKQSLAQDNVIDLESDEEVIEHEPVTGDIDLTKKSVSKLPAPLKPQLTEKPQSKDPNKKETVITENEFDKFARRNSITFEDCLTVKYDGKEPANVVQTVKEKEPKVNPKNEIIRTDAKSKLPQKATSQINPKIPHTKFGPLPEDPNNKNYQTKIHTAYQSALTAKRQMDRPITIIEDKPVKVVFMDANAEFVPNQLNVQGKELSPAKKAMDSKVSPQAVSSDVTDATEDQQDDIKAKTKHQRKQVLNPVEAPELELVQPRDLGFDVSPKKKRKTDDNKTEKNLKNLVHKKSYLLGRARTDETTTSQEVAPVKETINRAETVTDRTVSAIDNLVKAAELLDNQSVHSPSPNSDSQQNTPVKRGRGRPRKYPLPEGASFSKTSPSPQKKPRLIDAKPVKRDPISDEESSDEEQMIRENWTMGKINENIVCPICNKLFRSENVVFKHVKHCTGVSPTRSDLEKRSQRDSDKSFESQSDDMDFDEKPKERTKNTYKKRKSKESPSSKSDEVDVIVIEDTPVKETTKEEPKSKTTEEKSEAAPDPVKEKLEKSSDKTVKEPTLKEIADEKNRVKKLELLSEKDSKEKKEDETKEDNPTKAKKLAKTTTQRSSNLVCEFCGKTFRQPSYLANHKLQHKKDHLKKLEAKLTAKLQVLSCEVCKKEFRKLHHLVQHRIIHNPEAPARTTRKCSSEQSDFKVKEQPAPKQSEDTSAGFRCEPCDKSFRKLHHLVEHRETHDGINRQKTNVQTVTQTIEKPPPPPQCDVCKKSFRKLHHLIEHKEQHHVEQVETSSEKSDDKSVQSSLSTRDIIHECSLCYMVFPNEHSLNKHFVICQQKKKRQSKAKDKPENVDAVDIVDESAITEDSMDVNDEPKVIAKEILDEDKVESEQENKETVPQKVEERKLSEKPAVVEKSAEVDKPGVAEIKLPKEEVTPLKSAPAKRELSKSDDGPDAKKAEKIPEKIKKIDEQVKEKPKKTLIKDRVAPTVTKRQKSLAPLTVVPEDKKPVESDDDEIKYMLNPDFKPDDTSEGKIFMKIRSNKRNSLQIERPNSRDLMNRRTSLQHPPKVPRLKAKAVEPKVVPTVTKTVKPNEATSTDSDDSDVKYSFPEKVPKPAPKEEMPKEKVVRKSLAEKRKSLSGIAKRKSVGQAIAKLKPNPSPVRVIKRRTLDVEHRCDCGQLFNSAALLTRHTSLAHTPPRIRRRRSPPPDPQPTNTRKSNVRSEASNSKPTRKSSVKSDTPETRKSKSQDKLAKPRRTPAHRGVPVPEKMRKLMMRNAK